MRFAGLPCALAMCVALIIGHSATANPADHPKVVIIIDDLGYKPALDRRVLELPREIAIAVLPGAPNATAIARSAHAQQRQILVHLPMQSLNETSNATLLDSAALTDQTTRDELRQIVAGAFAAVPHASGLNNHMGSLMTQRTEPMRWLMESLACRRDAYFIDSFTTADSVALSTAQLMHIPAMRRHVFLDDDPDYDAVVAELERLVIRARKDGQAVAIGHPLPETLQALVHVLPTLESQGVQLVSLEDVVHRPEREADPELAMTAW